MADSPKNKGQFSDLKSVWGNPIEGSNSSTSTTQAQKIYLWIKYTT